MDNNYFIHPQGICESKNIGSDTKIWAFAHILPQAEIGRNCNICDYVFVENDVSIGNNVTVKCGVQLWDGIRVEDNVFIGPNVTFTNDIFPRSKQYPGEFAKTIVRKNASIGANATILPGIEIGEMAMVGAGAVVTENVPPKAVVVGNPARITRYVGQKHIPHTSVLYPEKENWNDNKSPRILEVNNGKEHVAIYTLPNFSDMRGKLSPIEFLKDLPFVPKRQFFVYGVPNHKVRGEHAHQECHQFLFAINGKLNVVVDDGKNSIEVHLDSPLFGLYMPPGIWGIQYRFSTDAILSVYASHSYNSKEYIRDYSEFMNDKKK